MNDSHGMAKRNMPSLCLRKTASVWRIRGFPGGSDSKEADYNAVGDPGSILGSGRSPGFLPGEFHGQRSLADYSPGALKELDMTE